MGCLPISRPLASRCALILLPLFEIVDHCAHTCSTREWVLGMSRNVERDLSLLEVCGSKCFYHLGFLDGVVRNPICSQLHRNDGNIMLCQTTGMKTGQASSLIGASPRRLPTSPRILRSKHPSSHNYIAMIRTSCATGFQARPLPRPGWHRDCHQENRRADAYV